MSRSSLINLLWYHWKRNSWALYLPGYLGLCDDVAIDRPMFLLGNQGAGLTLVSRMIRRHPEVVSVTGSHHYWSGADEMQRVMLPRLPESLRLGGRFLWQDGIHHPQFTPPRSWSYASDDLIGGYRKTAADYDEEAARKLRRIIKEALHRHGDGGQGKRFVDKSQVFSVKMSYIDALLEGCDPYFILITRNPYAACYRAAVGKAADMARYAAFMRLEERIEICAQHWSNTMQAVLEDKETVKNFIAFRFEDVLRQPREILKKLCGFLGLPFVEDMVPSEAHTIPLGSTRLDRWHPLRPEVNKPYLEEVSQSHTETISEHCESIAMQFGYLPPR